MNSAYMQTLAPCARERREALLTALTEKASREGTKGPQLAEQLGLTEQDLLELLLGIQRIEEISEDLVQVIAHYLKWPVIAVRFSSGALRLEDFFTPETLSQAVQKAKTRWPELEQSSELTAVFALVLAGQEVVPGNAMRRWMTERPQACGL